MIIHPRSAWSPAHGVGPKTPAPQSQVAIHHAPERRLPANPTRAQVAEQIRIMEKHHAEKHTPTNPRLSYQWIAVDQTAEIWEGIGWDRIGAHVKNNNTPTLGILILGIDGERSAGRPETWRAIAALIDQGIRRGSLVARPSIGPHSRWVATACPGGALKRYIQGMTIDTLRAMLAPPVLPTEVEVPIIPTGIAVPHGSTLAAGVARLREQAPPHLQIQPITRPQPQHLEAAALDLGIAPSVLRLGVPAVERVVRGMIAAAAAGSPRADALAELLEALGGFRSNN